jgi:hypothetical protein
MFDHTVFHRWLANYISIHPPSGISDSYTVYDYIRNMPIKALVFYSALYSVMKNDPASTDDIRLCAIRTFIDACNSAQRQEEAAEIMAKWAFAG